MWTLFDTIGASIIGSSIIFMVLALNLQMNKVSTEITEHNIIQSHYTASMDILEYDLHKMGYRADGEIILHADSTSLRYLVDLGDDGNVDTVFYMADTSLGDSIGNVIYIDRQINDNYTDNIGIVSEFHMTYFDSLGNTIVYDDLELQANRARIRTIGIQLELTVEDGDASGYKDVNWRLRIQPKNLLARI